MNPDPEMSLAPLRIAAAKYALDALSHDDMRRVADEALKSGVYTYSLGELGTTTDPSVWVARPLFEASMRELGISLPTQDAALSVLLTDYFGRVLEGASTPLDTMARVVKDLSWAWNTDFEERSENLDWLQRLEGFDLRYLELEQNDMDAERAAQIVAPIDHDFMLVAGNWFNKLASERLDVSWHRWNDGAVRRLAQAVRDGRRFLDLPLLADALEAAGCTDVDILEHCRERAAHVTDCWVIHLLLADA